MPIATIVSILEAVVSDLPTLVQVVEKLIAVYKSKDAPTSEDWQELNALADKSHKDLQS